MRFANENLYDSTISEAGAAWDVDAALIKGIIGAESEFKATAYRAEPKINDASYGLMQLLYGTAKALGYTGSTSGLFDPATNIRLGTRYLRDLIKTAAQRGYGVDSAVSAYNAGFSAVRPGDGKRTTNDAGAPFVNQPYVDKVIELANYFSRAASGQPQQLETVTVYAQAANNVWSWFAFAVPIALFLLIPSKRRR